MKITLKEKLAFRSHIFSWWNKYKRDLPWRHTNNPYNIFISEIMLQQTQVRRVFTKYAEFIETYPTVFAYRQDITMIDTNIRHIITHFFFHDIADQLLPKGRSWEWHQALMDYGAEESSKFKV